MAASSDLQAIWSGVLEWTCAQLFLALRHLPLAVSLLAHTPGRLLLRIDYGAQVKSACNWAAAAVPTGGDLGKMSKVLLLQRQLQAHG